MWGPCRYVRDLGFILNMVRRIVYWVAGPDLCLREPPLASVKRRFMEGIVTAGSSFGRPACKTCRAQVSKKWSSGPHVFITHPG